MSIIRCLKYLPERLREGSNPIQLCKLEASCHKLTRESQTGEHSHNAVLARERDNSYPIVREHRVKPLGANQQIYTEHVRRGGVDSERHGE